MNSNTHSAAAALCVARFKKIGCDSSRRRVIYYCLTFYQHWSVLSPLLLKIHTKRFSTQHLTPSSLSPLEVYNQVRPHWPRHHRTGNQLLTNLQIKPTTCDVDSVRQSDREFIRCRAFKAFTRLESLTNMIKSRLVGLCSSFPRFVGFRNAPRSLRAPKDYICMIAAVQPPAYTPSYLELQARPCSLLIYAARSLVVLLAFASPAFAAHQGLFELPKPYKCEMSRRITSPLNLVFSSLPLFRKQHLFRTTSDL